MEFPFDVQRAVGGTLVMIDSKVLRGIKGQQRDQVCSVIDKMGAASGKAQGLGAVITTAHKMISSDHRLYLAASRKKALGFIKTGVKHLFIRVDGSAMKEIDPVCVLDFYVHESCQRRGLGKRLYDSMLTEEEEIPAKLAYDRPSPKLLGFLRKHCGLRNYTPQANNYVVFKQYFAAARTKKSRAEHEMATVGARPLTGRRGRRRGDDPEPIDGPAPYNPSAAVTVTHPLRPKPKSDTHYYGQQRTPTTDVSAPPPGPSYGRRATPPEASPPDPYGASHEVAADSRYGSHPGLSSSAAPYTTGAEPSLGGGGGGASSDPRYPPSRRPDPYEASSSHRPGDPYEPSHGTSPLDPYTSALRESRRSRGASYGDTSSSAGGARGTYTSGSGYDRDPRASSSSSGYAGGRSTYGGSSRDLGPSPRGYPPTTTTDYESRAHRAAEADGVRGARDRYGPAHDTDKYGRPVESRVPLDPIDPSASHGHGPYRLTGTKAPPPAYGAPPSHDSRSRTGSAYSYSRTVLTRPF